MAPKTFFAAVGALVAAVAVNAQAAPNWAYIPTACESQCSETIETSYLCQQQNMDSGTQTYGCFCAAYPSDAAGCSTCLTENDSSALASLLTATEQDCPAAFQRCAFACAFDTCPEGDVNCACSDNYLANIYNCASCNSANGNTGATGLTDFEALRDSCSNQGFAGANQTFATRAANSPTGQDAYAAPTLTATGGGPAATGDAAELGAVSASGNGAGAAPNPTESGADAASESASATASESAQSGMTSPTTMSRASSVSASRMSSARSSASGASGAAASPTSSGNGAMGMVAPATGIVAILGAVAALL